jgi:hypothetical protein
LTVPALTTAVAGTEAVSDVALTKVVVNCVPVPKYTLDAAVNPVPVTVIVKAAAVAGIVLGDIELRVGPVIVKLIPEVAEPPGFTTVTFTVPAALAWADATVAVIEVEVAAVTVSAVLPHMTLEPEVPGTKFVPVTVRLNGEALERAVVGLSDVILGAPTVNVEPAEVAPPGFCTVMPTVPAVASEAVGTVATIDVGVPDWTVSAVEPM